MKLFRKLYRSNTIVLTTVLMYFLFFHAVLMTCCPCASGNSQVLSGDLGHHHNKHFTGTHKQNMNVSVMTLLSFSSNNHDCGCKEITVSNYLVEENWSSYRSIKPDKYHFSFAHFSDSIPNASVLFASIQHFLPSLIGSSTIQSIRTVVILI